jgi:uncharacterized protein YggU (UPF0235/DUF167 family)
MRENIRPMATPDLTFAVRLTPASGADKVMGVTDGELIVRVSAPPIDGTANEALLRLLARELRVPRSALRLAAGRTGRLKRVAVDAVAAAAVRARWPELGV